MKSMFYAVVCILALNAGFVFAQQPDYEIEVFLNDTSISRESEESTARIKITNNDRRALRTNALFEMHFYFSKCAIGTPCNDDEDTFAAVNRIPSKEIAQFDSFEFEVNLADLFWKDVNQNPNHTANVRNFTSVPAGNIYFHAAVKRLEGYESGNPGSKGARLPIYKIVNSNMIGVSFNN